MDIKKINRRLKINTYIIYFEYETFKGHRREQTREVKGFDKEDVKDYFKSWASSMRTMVNVQILSIEELENKVVIIGI